MRKYSDPRLMAADELVAKGEELHRQKPGLYDKMVANTCGSDVAVLCTTSGTEPKLKCYLEARRPPNSSIALAQERRLARARLARLRAEMSVALGLGPD